MSLQPSAAHFAQLSDDQLLRPASESESLTAEGAALLQAELDSRCLVPARAEAYEAQTIATEEATSFSYNSVWRKLRWPVFWLGHTAIGSLATSMTAAVVYETVKPLLIFFVPPSRLAHNSLLMVSLFPFQMPIALLVGVIFSRGQGAFWRSRSAWLSWVLPVCLLFVLVAAYQSSSVMTENRWQHFFWSSDRFSKAIQMGITLPSLASMMYALGHYLGRPRCS